MAYIDPEGMFGGDRMAMLPDKTRWIWPWLWVSSNDAGRLELNYKNVMERAFRQFKAKPTEDQFWEWVRDCQAAYLLFVYEYNGQLWGAWDVPDRFLPRFKRRAAQTSPAPLARAFLDWRREYEELKRKRAMDKCRISNIAGAEPANGATTPKVRQKHAAGVSGSSKGSKINKKTAHVINSRESAHDKENEKDNDNEINTPCPAGAEQKRRKSAAGAEDPWIIEQHSRWYEQAYWRRVKRPESLRAYARRLAVLMTREKLDKDAAAEFLFRSAIEDRKRWEPSLDWSRWRCNLHPATWLNSEMWNDEAPVIETLPVAGGSNGHKHVQPVRTATDQRRSETLATLDAIDKIKGRVV